ncbi:alcohol dehydrogenase [Streptomyces lydicus]|uniref:alcohol dehydrogenase n=1 Tax=Streptomyces lydicus TaxID=47763 RepID=UPI0036FA7A5A
MLNVVLLGMCGTRQFQWPAGAASVTKVSKTLGGSFHAVGERGARAVGDGHQEFREQPGDVGCGTGGDLSLDEDLRIDVDVMDRAAGGPGDEAGRLTEADGPWAGQVVDPSAVAVFGGIEAGETLLVSGATGNFGSSAVAVSLALGAGRVVAPGRNRAALDLLAARFGPRVRPVRLTGDEAADHASMAEAADGPIDMVLDLLPPSAPSSAARAAVMTVREYGRVVLMGGVGMLGGDDLGLPYPWIMRNSITVRGQWLYPRRANVGMVRLLASGALDLAPERVRSFRLDAVNDAVAYAAAHGGPFDRTVLTPTVG